MTIPPPDENPARKNIARDRDAIHAFGDMLTILMAKNHGTGTGALYQFPHSFLKNLIGHLEYSSQTTARGLP